MKSLRFPLQFRFRHSFLGFGFSRAPCDLSLLSFSCAEFACRGFPTGDDGIRTHDPLLAGQVLSQLSYTPIWFAVALFFGFNDLFRSLKIEQQALCTFRPYQ